MAQTSNQSKRLSAYHVERLRMQEDAAAHSLK